MIVSASLLVFSAVAWGQVARRPSVRTLDTLDYTLGHVGMEKPNNFSNRNSGQVATVAPQPGRRSSGRSSNGYQQFTPPRRGSLLGTNTKNPWSMNRDPFSSRSFDAGAMYPEFSTRNPVLLFRRDEAVATASPDVALKAPSNPLTDPASGTEKDTAQIQLPREQLVKRYIDGHRSDYFARGWAAFKAGQYRVACDLFGLAEAVSFSDIAERTEAKFALLHASIASRQYALAVNTLHWLLEDDPRTGEMRDKSFLNRIKNIDSLYPSKAEYVAQVRQLEEMGIAYPTSQELKALRAVVLWGQNDRARATYYAKELAGTPDNLPWSKLYTLMETGQAEPIFMSDVPPATKPAL
jgi:hypothetical protein